MKPRFALLVGVVFGIGLCLSGMVAPSKVLNFLDVAGAWDPSLALVMGGAMAAAFLPFRLVRGRIPAPGRRIDLPLVAGSALFGVGWGLVGLCPGPALTALGRADPKAFAFVAAMLVGMALHRLWSRGATKTPPAPVADDPS
ncbi:hypothetical protein EYW49_15885 [Siculibacillus lacustris]|uniref:YeeE/YedE family protein n=1 Tax=Siculibacillus lacustris TaxID=1549641 RepID=A0A4Q9VLI5_9HYPH|nr:DUF6691 family protein [Siculibacillus lacustris]TBW35506.1 hypothetical protein EYW49_15885 [Siculibacillus lacustris]